MLIADGLARLVLERVRIDRVEAEPELGGALAQGAVIGRPVPRKMRRYPRCDPAQPVDHRGVLEPFADGRGLARQSEAGEPGAAAPQPPARQRDRKGRRPRREIRDPDPAAGEGARQRVVVLVEGAEPGRGVGLDQIVCERHGGGLSDGRVRPVGCGIVGR